jgi:hypothetical protein
MDTCLVADIANFLGGQIADRIDFWHTLTSDTQILANVRGCKLEFLDLPEQFRIPEPYHVSKQEALTIDGEIEKLLKKSIIKLSHYEPGQYVSNIFIRPKKDGSHRLILNLKGLNDSIVKRHFKMQTLQSAIKLMTKDAYMASIDWKDAYYTVPVAQEDQKYLKFCWKGNLFAFTCLPNGLASAPRLFTKITKPVYSTLRKMGHENCSYIDDSFLQGQNVPECRLNVIDTVNITRQSGFVIHPKKSVFEPTQTLTYVGFILSTIDMLIRLTPQKIEKLKAAALTLRANMNPTIRQVAEVVGLLVSSFPGVEYGQLFYRLLENEKSQALSQARGNFELHMSLSEDSRQDLKWWALHIDTASCPVSHGGPDIILQSDASLTGWGGVHASNKTGGNWSTQESTMHINQLEILAAFLTLKTFCPQERNVHIQMQVDNTTAVAYINKLGGKSPNCNAITRDMWLWGWQRHIWLSATHIPGVCNVVADQQSRIDHDNTEWKLHPDLFQELVHIWGNPDIDLFASRLNYQMVPYMSWKPDPTAQAVDAFSAVWKDKFVYIFCPFNLIATVLQKIELERVEAIMIVPQWTTQPWYSKLMRMISDCLFLLPRTPSPISHPSKTMDSLPKMRLLACRVSGLRSRHEEFLEQRRTSYCLHGGQARKNSTCYTSRSGTDIVLKGVQMNIHHLFQKF